jgi:glyoxylase-like metal-dependent hydrolase (beta-lactamase superfamily II)
MKANFLLVVVAVSACSVSTHPVKPSALGTSSRSSAMLAVIDQPGPLTVETISSCDWSVRLSNLLNLDDPRAKAAGLKDRDEPTKIFFHVIRHPTKGTFIVDTGVEKALRDDPDHAALRGIVKSFMHVDRMKFPMPLGDWVAKNKLDGVMLTHLHADHITGMPDVPHGTPIYAGPGETRARALQNVLAQGFNDREFAGQEAISEWPFQPDPDGRFDGIVDVFGDGSLWAILTPGHTPGHTAYLARTAQGPVLLVGDNSHTKWGWNHDVEPGGFAGDRPRAILSLKKMRALAAEHPKMSVRLGHQAME